MNIPYNYITLLKRLPKHSQGVGDSNRFAQDKKDLRDRQIALAETNKLIKEQDSFVETLTNAYYNLTAAGDDFGKSQLGLTKSASSVNIGLNKLIGLKETLGKSLIKAAKATTFLEQRNKELNKALGINSVTAAELGEKYDKIGLAFGTGGKQIRKYAQVMAL